MAARSALLRTLLCILIAWTSRTAAQAGIASRAPSLFTRLKACNGDKAALSNRAASCAASLAKSKKRVRQLAPAGSRLADCNRVASALSVKLSSKTGSLRRCNANNEMLNQQLITSKRRGLVSARSAGVALASEDEGSAGSARIADLKAEVKLLEVQLQQARATIKELEVESEDNYMLMAVAQNEMYAALAEGVDQQDVLHTCLEENLSNVQDLTVCTNQFEGSSASRKLYKDQLDATNVVFERCLKDLANATINIAELTKTEVVTPSEDEETEAAK